MPLFPSKIAAYIEKAERKKRKESINIPFVKLAKNADTLYYIVKQFDNESKQQGTMFTPLVQNRIRVDEFEKIRYEVQVMSFQGEKQDEEKMKKLQEMYEILMKEPKIKEYFDIEVRFNIMLADVNKIISESVKELL